jgi:hypothetical protein
MDILAFGDPFFGPWEAGENGSDIFQNYYSSDNTVDLKSTRSALFLRKEKEKFLEEKRRAKSN